MKKENKKKKGISVDELILLDMMEEDDGSARSGCLVFIIGAGLMMFLPIVLASVMCV